MTRAQIAESLDLHINYVSSAFEAAIKEHPELDLYDPSNNKKGMGVDYTLEQVYLALSYLRDGKGISEIEKNLLTEDFKMREPEKLKAKGIRGSEEFIEKIKKYPKLRCCSTCAYCTKSTMRNRKPVPKPFCNLYERFLHRIKADPYKDHCNHWVYSGKEPLIFYEHNSPTNVDIYGNVKNEILGYDLKCFGKENTDEAKLVIDIGFTDMPEITSD